MKAVKQQVARKALAEESEAPATGNGAMLFGMLWCLAILVFGVGDLLISSLAFGLGAVEGNPILRSMMGTFGDGIWPLLIVKGILLSALFVLSCKSLGIYGWAIPIVLICAGIYMLVPNIEALMPIILRH